MATGRKSEAKREAVALSLASGQTAKAAAAACGVSERTIGNWLNESSFVQRVDSLRADMVSRAAGRIADDMTRAAKTLRKLLSDPDSRVRLGAARAVLENGVRLREATILEARVAELEKAAAARKGTRP
jgi:transposase-like protein